MAKSTRSKKGGGRGRRPGLPAPESVVSVKRFTSAGGRVYRILKTTEQDAYDPPLEQGPRKKPKG